MRNLPITRSPASSLPPSPQIGYNADGVFVSWVSICTAKVTDASQVQASAMVYSFPKWGVYRVRSGKPRGHQIGAGPELRVRGCAMVYAFPKWGVYRVR